MKGCDDFNIFFWLCLFFFVNLDGFCGRGYGWFLLV